MLKCLLLVLVIKIVVGMSGGCFKSIFLKFIDYLFADILYLLGLILL